MIPGSLILSSTFGGTHFERRSRRIQNKARTTHLDISEGIGRAMPKKAPQTVIPVREIGVDRFDVRGTIATA